MRCCQILLLPSIKLFCTEKKGTTILTFFDKMDPPRQLMAAKFNYKTHLYVKYVFRFFWLFCPRLALKLAKNLKGFFINVS
jgi:hypothetical protein